SLAELKKAVRQQSELVTFRIAAADVMPWASRPASSTQAACRRELRVNIVKCATICGGGGGASSSSNILGRARTAVPHDFSDGGERSNHPTSEVSLVQDTTQAVPARWVGSTRGPILRTFWGGH